MDKDLTKMVEEWRKRSNNINDLYPLFLAMAAEIEGNREEIEKLNLISPKKTMGRKLTDQQKGIYLEQHPEQCPFCRSEDIGILVAFDGAKQSRTCNDCNRRWTDHYTLTGVEEEE